MPAPSSLHPPVPDPSQRGAPFVPRSPNWSSVTPSPSARSQSIASTGSGPYWEPRRGSVPHFQSVWGRSEKSFGPSVSRPGSVWSGPGSGFGSAVHTGSSSPTLPPSQHSFDRTPGHVSQASAYSVRHPPSLSPARPGSSQSRLSQDQFSSPSHSRAPLLPSVVGLINQPHLHQPQRHHRHSSDEHPFPARATFAAPAPAPVLAPPAEAALQQLALGPPSARHPPPLDPEAEGDAEAEMRRSRPARRAAPTSFRNESSHSEAEAEADADAGQSSAEPESVSALPSEADGDADGDGDVDVDVDGETALLRNLPLDDPDALIDKLCLKAIYPSACIKRQIQKDEDVGKIAQVVPLIVGKSVQLFMVSLIAASVEKARESNTRRLANRNLLDAIHHKPEFDFLREIDAVQAATSVANSAAASGNPAGKTRRPGPGPGRRRKKDDAVAVGAEE